MRGNFRMMIIALAGCCLSKLSTAFSLNPRREASSLVSCQVEATPQRNDIDVSSRRHVLRTAATAATLAGVTSISLAPAWADTATSSSTRPFAASWSAVDGLNSLEESNKNLVSFDMNAYRAMRDDQTRTPLFERAIVDRLGSDAASQTVLDLGTGPFALFAILAAQNGAGKVYAIEASPQAAESARNFVKSAGYSDVITVVQGFSTQVDLPEKVDFCVAEIVGSIASEEGAYATIRNAHRFLKEPTRDDSWIPNRIQTYAAPASYSLHTLFKPPEFDWTKLNGEPVRFNCRDQGLQLLSDPVLVEDLYFSEILTKGQDKRNSKQDFTFTVGAKRMDENAFDLYDEFRRGSRSSEKDSQALAYETSHSMSGIACWPRLILNDDITVDSRHHPDGGHQKSHWQTVLPIASGRPLLLTPDSQIKVTIDFTLPTDAAAPRYRMNGVVL